MLVLLVEQLHLVELGLLEAVEVRVQPAENTHRAGAGVKETERRQVPSRTHSASVAWMRLAGSYCSIFDMRSIPAASSSGMTRARSCGFHWGNSCQSRKRETPGHTSSEGVPSSLGRVSVVARATARQTHLNMCRSCCSSESPGKRGVLRASSAGEGAVSRALSNKRHPSHRRCSQRTTCRRAWSSGCLPAAPLARGTRASQSAGHACQKAMWAARTPRLVRVALDGDAECAAEAQVCYLENVASLVDEQVLRLQVPGKSERRERERAGARKRRARARAGA